jgi:hypothetical protein
MVSIPLKHCQIISNTWLCEDATIVLQTPEHRFDTICSCTCIMEEILILLHYSFEGMLIYQYTDIRVRTVFIT